MNRRAFLRAASGAGAAALTTSIRTIGQGPAIVTSDALRPLMPSGIQSGDVTADGAIIWSRADRPSRMHVEVAYDEAFNSPTHIAGPAALAVTDFTARVDVSGLKAGEPVFYRVWFESLEQKGASSEPIAGRFRTAPRAARDLLLAWTGDTVGQGWGINPEFGGLRGYRTMLDAMPDVFVHSGDMIYADGPLQPEVRLPDGRVWKNLVTPAKSRVAETLDDFRGNFAYNLLDEHVRRFNAAVPMLAQWDDHEVLNNWNPATDLSNDPRYTIKSVDLLSALARRAMFEYVPIRQAAADSERVYRSIPYGPQLEVLLLDERSYRGPNSGNRQDSAGPDTAMLGRAQLDWLKRRLQSSTATWKVIASDMPIGLVVGDGKRDGRLAYEAWANGEGPPLGRELELKELLAFIRERAIHDIVWITADVHYATALQYDPARAVFTDFLPFWEFVAGPIHAGTFGPGTIDPTFGPRVAFRSAEPGAPQNRAPWDGHQFFGTLQVHGRSGRLTASLVNIAGEVVYRTELEPQGH
jgi:alkaline phosphatase D